MLLNAEHGFRHPSLKVSAMKYLFSPPHISQIDLGGRWNCDAFLRVKQANFVAVGIHPDQIDDSNAVDIELNAGDIFIHNPNIIHGSNANTSGQWRVGLTLRYISTTTWVKNKYENHENILLRGKSSPNVKNVYAQRPRYISGKHMPFRGYEEWNEHS